MKLGERYLKGKSHFYLMHLSYEGAERERLWSLATSPGEEMVGLDLPGEVPMDWNNLPERNKQRLRQNRSTWYRQFEIFCNEMTKGDVVVVMWGWNPILGIGKIVVEENNRPYDYRDDLTGVFFNHVRKISWDYSEKPIQLDVPLNGFNNALLEVRPNSPFWNKIFNVNL